MALSKKKFGNKSLKREIEIITALLVFFLLAMFGIMFAIQSQYINFDNRNEAAGRTFFVANSTDLESALTQAVTNDAIFLKVGSYTSSTPNGFSIKGKNIRILGAGSDFVTINAASKQYGFTVESSNVVFDGISITGATKSGILVTNSNTKSVIVTSSKISGSGESGIKSDSETSVSISTFDANAKGIESSNGNLLIGNSVIRNATTHGVQVLQGSTGSLTVLNSVFYKNLDKGISIDGGTNNSIKNVSLLENGTGISESVSTSSTSIINTAVLNSEKLGVSLTSASSSIKYSNAFNNKGGNFSPATIQAQEGNLSINAPYAADTFRFTGISPLADKGLPAEKDKDGSRIDIGAFGGSPNLLALNSKPTITSTPASFVKAGEKYTYEIKATDPDLDTLTYTILNSNKPSWLTLSGNVLSGTPKTTDVGFYGVMLVVGDKQGHNIVQPVSINVIPSSRVVVGTTTVPTATTVAQVTPTQKPTITPTAKPTPTQIPTPTAVPTVEPTKDVSKISFVAPLQDSSYDPGNVEIKWQLTNAENIESVTVKYSLDGENFQTLTSVLPTQTTYIWDTSNVEAGKYIIKIEAKEKGTDPLTVAELSPQFELKDVPKNVGASELVITKISPAENDVTTDFKPLIFIEFKPDIDLDKSKSYLKADGTDLDFKYTKSTMYFEPQVAFTGNKVQVEAKIVGTNGSQTTKKWTFSLPSQSNSTGTKTLIDQDATILGLPRPVGLAILGIVILALLGAILYFVIKLVKTVRDERQGSLEAEFIEYYDTPQQAKPEPAPQPVQSVEPMPDMHAVQTDMNEYLAPTIIEEAIVENTPVQTESAPLQEMPLAGQEGVFTQTEIKNTVENDLQSMTGATGDQTMVDPSQYQEESFAQSYQQQLQPQETAVEQKQEVAPIEQQQQAPQTPVVQQDVPLDPFIEELKKKYKLPGTQADTTQPTPTQPTA